MANVTPSKRELIALIETETSLDVPNFVEGIVNFIAR